MPVSNSGSGKHKKYIEEKLSKLMPTLIKVGLGNFSVKIEIPKEEDEFTELLVALNLMIEEHHSQNQIVFPDSLLFQYLPYQNIDQRKKFH